MTIIKGHGPSRLIEAYPNDYVTDDKGVCQPLPCTHPPEYLQDVLVTGGVDLLLCTLCEDMWEVDGDIG